MNKTKGRRKETVFMYCETKRERSELEIKRSKSSAFETRKRIRLTFSEPQKLAKASPQGCFYSRKREESQWEQWNWWHFNLPCFSCPPQLHSNLENKHLRNYGSFENQQPSSQPRKQNGFWNFPKACPQRITNIWSFWHLSEKLHSPELSLFDWQLTMPKALSWIYLSETVVIV